MGAPAGTMGNTIILRDHALDHYRCLQGNGFLDSGCHFFLFGHADGGTAQSFCHLAEIHLILQYCLGIAFPIEQCLPLSYHAQHLVVDDHLDDGNVYNGWQ